MPWGQLSPRAADTEALEPTTCALQQGSHREQKASHHCYPGQALSARFTTGQWTRETRCWAKEEALIREPADRDDGRLAPQNNHLLGVWMPGSFIEQRERSNEELKSKGRIEREIRWGIKWKGLQSGDTSPRECPTFRRGVWISSIHRWAGTSALSMSWTKAL